MTFPTNIKIWQPGTGGAYTPVQSGHDYNVNAGSSV